MDKIIRISITDKNDKVWRTNLIQTGFHSEYSIILVSESYDYHIKLILCGEPTIFELTEMVNKEVMRHEEDEMYERLQEWLGNAQYSIEEFLDEISSTYIFEEALTYENMKKIKEKVEDILSCGDDLLYYLNKILEG